jgi:hypothetical protein
LRAGERAGKAEHDTCRDQTGASRDD